MADTLAMLAKFGGQAGAPIKAHAELLGVGGAEAPHADSGPHHEFHCRTSSVQRHTGVNLAGSSRMSRIAFAQ